MYSIIPLRALNDNYIWIIKAQDGNGCICIDPGEASPVKKFLAKENIALNAILITHHHFDHTDGIAELHKEYSPKIFAPSKSIHPKVNLVSNNDAVTLPGIESICRVLATPGHTLDHVIYNIEDMLFTGDTLFSAGCGKVFEGTYQMMYESLGIIASFPDNYKIFCGHEYTKNNLTFAAQIDGLNGTIISKLEQIHKNGENFITLPSTIAEEKQINPFLRCENSDIMQGVQKKCSRILQGPVDVFSTLRKWKDKF